MRIERGRVGTVCASVVIAFAFVCLSITLSNVAGEADVWTKQGLAIDVGLSSEWDRLGTIAPCVIHDDDGLYKMWYVGVDDLTGRIGYAYSEDGLNWVKPSLGIFMYNGNTDNNIVINIGPSGSWKDLGVGRPSILKDGDTYKMWYIGDGGHTLTIGYATSSDGIHWTDYEANPVLTPGDYFWENTDICSSSVLLDDGVYRMWYTGVQNNLVDTIGYAHSYDGISWTKHADPVLTPSIGSEWDSGEVAVPRVVKYCDAYEMFYSGISGVDAKDSKIGSAVSFDGISWVKEGIVISNGCQGDLDELEVSEGCTIVEADGSFKMWYTGKDSEGTNRILWASLMLPTTIYVIIDVQPGSSQNYINILEDNDVILVAIFGDDDFDVAEVNVSSVNLQGLDVKISGKSGPYFAHYDDINEDGIIDLTVQVEDADGMFVEGQTEAVLKGMTYSGNMIEGSDYIRVVPCYLDA